MMSVDLERTQKLEEIAKIKAEIDDLIIQKAQIVSEINVPIYKARAEAEKIIKEANLESEIIIGTAKRLESEATQNNVRTEELLRNAKGDIEKLANDKKALGQERLDFQGERVAHENLTRQHRNTVFDQTNQNRMDSERVQQQLIETKQREDATIRKEAILKAKEDDLKMFQETVDARSKTLDEYAAKIEAQQTTAEQTKLDNAAKEQELLSLQDSIVTEKSLNQKILDEIKAHQADLTRQQNDLARQIEISDNSKAEVEEKTKAMKEQCRLNDLKIRQNEERIATLKQLRENDDKQDAKH